MIPIQAFKKSLRDIGEHLTDKELENLLQFDYQLANTFFDLWKPKGKRGIVSGNVIVTHEKNGKCVAAFGFGFIYTYA